MTNQQKILFLIIPFLCFFTRRPLLQENDIKFRTLSWSQGLSCGTVYDIIQDRQGFMWFATPDGLNRYDSRHIKVYRHSPLDTNSIAVNWCQSLHVDKFGKLWIGTLYGGLNLYDPDSDKFTAFKHDPENPRSLSNDVVPAICEDDSGNLWLGTWGGLNKLVRDNRKDPHPNFPQFVHYKHDPNNPTSLSDDRIWTLYIDNAGIIWIGTEAGGLNRFDPKTETFQQYKHDPQNPNSISNNRVRCIYEYPIPKRRVFWVGTMGGLNIFDVQNEIFSDVPYDPTGSEKKENRKVLTTLRDKNGELWIGTTNGLEKDISTVKDEFPQNFLSFRKDFSNPLSLRSNYIKSLYEDSTGILWIGTVGGGVSRVISRKNNFQNYSRRIPFFSKVGNVISIYEDESGIWWLGTPSGMCEVDRDKKLVVRYRHDPNNSNSLSSNEIYSIYEEPNSLDKTLWILCRGGGLDKLIIKDQPGTENEKVSVHHVLPNPSDSVSSACKLGLCLLRDKKGMFWIGTDNGLYQFDQEGGNVIQYLANPQDLTSLISERVDKIYQSPFDSGNILWLGTANGLYRIDTDFHSFVHYIPDPTANNSLSDIRIISLLADATTHGKILWIGTWSGGLNKLNIETGAFRHFTRSDGFPSNTIYSILQDEKGFLWVGTNNGLTKFDPQTETFNTYGYHDGLHFGSFYPGGAFKNSRTRELLFGGDGVISFFPDSIIDNTYVPPILLTDFKVFNKPFKLNQSITKTEKIQLSYRQNFFSFEFNALEYNKPERFQYAYKLEGIDKDWIYCGYRNYASYTNISGGNYVFKVKRLNTAGVGNEEEISVKIVITPPFWKTNWFRFSFVIWFLGLFFLVYNLRVSRLKKERNAQQSFSKQLIETQEQERKRIAGGLHDSLGQNLLIIKNGLQHLINTLLIPKHAMNDLDEISSLTSESIHEVREISYNLHPHLLDRLGLKKAMVSIIHKFSQSSEIKFESEITDLDNLFPKEYEIHIFRILQECLNNIIKHSEATKAFIQVKKSINQLSILIHDNGKGFELFDNNVENLQIAGLGLRGISERVKILNGILVINTGIKSGVEIRIELPLKSLK